MSPEWRNLPCPLVGFHACYISSNWKKQRKSRVGSSHLSFCSENQQLCSGAAEKSENFSFLQPRRHLAEHNHGGGLPDDRHTLQLGRLSVCCQGRPLVCRPQLRLPAAAAGLSEHTTFRGKHTHEWHPDQCQDVVFILPYMVESSDNSETP